MDPSALIFLALAVAWAAYLIPKALEHHEESLRSRTVDKFSRGMRVVARRESVGKGKAELVTPRRPSAQSRSAQKPAEKSLRRPAASPAARRRRVLGLVLLVNLIVVVLASASVVAWVWVAALVALLVTWLVACRLMVKQERRPARARRDRPAPVSWKEPVVPAPMPAADIDPADLTEEHAAVPTEAAADGTWDVQPVTLPTYVSQPPAARRSVRQIDLDSTGVWTSGRREADSRLVRDADEAARSEAESAAAKAERNLG